MDRIHNTSFSYELRIGLNKLVLQYTRLTKLSSDKHSSLLEALISYEKKKCFKYGPSKVEHLKEASHG
jgi:hypothetical protein